MAGNVTMRSADARAHWGETLEQAHHHGPVHITLNRRPYVFLASEEYFAEAEAAKAELAAMKARQETG